MCVNVVQFGHEFIWHLNCSHEHFQRYFQMSTELIQYLKSVYGKVVWGSPD